MGTKPFVELGRTFTTTSPTLVTVEPVVEHQRRDLALNLVATRLRIILGINLADFDSRCEGRDESG